MKCINWHPSIDHKVELVSNAYSLKSAFYNKDCENIGGFNEALKIAEDMMGGKIQSSSELRL